MKRLRFSMVGLWMLAGVLAAASLGAREMPNPPVAKKVPKISVIHGETRVDNYFWLREKQNPEVVSYLEAENKYTDAVMKSTEALQETLYKEMLGRIKQTDLSVPEKENGYWYYSRTEEGKQYPIICRKKGSLNAPEEVVLDGNKLAEGQKFFSLGGLSVSDDGQLAAYSTDYTGFRQYTLRIRDLRTGKDLPDNREKVVAFTWAADNKTLFYTVEDQAKRSARVYRHRLGEAEDALIYDEKDERFNVYVNRSRSDAYVFLHSSSLTTSEVRYLPAGEPDGSFKLIAERIPDQQYRADHRGDLFYITVNDTGRNFRLVTVPVASPGRESWKELVPHRPEVMLAGAYLFKDHMVLFERENALEQISVHSFKSRETHRITFPEPVYSAFPNGNAEFDTATYQFSYQSYVTPSSIFDYDMGTRKRKLLKQYEVLGGYDPTQYISERIYATAPDGVKVPVSLVRRKDVPRDGKAPLYLTAYGSYGASSPVFFSSNLLSLLDRGVVFAQAHIRGGGDLGKTWHDQGRMLNKKNTFTDFIAAAEHLVAEKYGSKDRLVIQGGSAGGLLMGAVTNMRPGLFKAVISNVPFVDVINTMLDPSLPLTVAEFEEWGDPKKKAEYDYMKTYCPYTNIEAKEYPAILVTTSLNDSQVMYWEPATYVAKLRAMKKDGNPLLLKTNMAGGHGGSSGRYDRLRETAFQYAFLLWQVGLADSMTAKTEQPERVGAARDSGR
ncbi:MAG TPA: S9 family peptidase [Thermoanaerobaculia bacterium]|nr:S9 family peptidase [Thermoanaerobaculia bacterium]